MKLKKNICFLILGTNLGNKNQNLKNALNHISNKAGSIVSHSHIYTTEPWGYADQPEFFNQVIKIETNLSSKDLLQQLLKIEHGMGRIRTVKNASRIIDIDILFYNDEIIKDETLTVPHKVLHKRRFVLEPLHEIAPDHVHPIFKKTIATLLKECDDNLKATMLPLSDKIN